MGFRVVNVALIGAGNIGRLHAETLAHHLPNARLAAVVEPIAERAHDAAAAAGSAVVTSELEAVLRDASVSAVVIAGPTRLHASLISAAARAGKHVFCEKPIALTLAEAQDAVAAADAHGVKLQVGFQRRFDDGYLSARDAVKNGELGPVEMVLSTTRDPVPPAPGYLESCGGMFLDTAIHDYDSVRFLSGEEIVDVFATASSLVTPERRGPFDIDTAVTVLRLASGALATITNSLRTGYGYEAGAEVFGAKGKLVISGGSGVAFQRFTSGNVMASYPQTYRERFGRAYRDELADFIRCIIDDDEPRCTGEDGVRALEIGLAATRSQREGRVISLLWERDEARA